MSQAYSATELLGHIVQQLTLDDGCLLTFAFDKASSDKRYPGSWDATKLT